MNLLENLENEEEAKRNKKSKTIMTVIIVMILALVLLCIFLVYMISDIQKNMIKLTIDSKQITKFSEDMFLFEDDTIYVSIKDFATLVGYEVYSGDHTSEDTTKGYIQNEYEEASYTLNSNKIYKQILTESDNEYYIIEKMVKMKNNKLYMSLDGIQIATTSAISYNQANNKFTVYTLPYLTTYYSTQVKDSAMADKELDFSNQKTLLYNMIIVKNSSGKYGVRDLSTNEEIIGTKYKSIKFIESTKEFIVTTDDNKMGIMSSTGQTKISPNYDEIKQMQKDLNLYLVKNNNKYGVINENENTIIHLEYDNIGIDITKYESNFEYSNNVKNKYVLFNNCIPVQKNSKWGIYDISGQKIVPIEYDDIGCIVSSNQSAGRINLLMIYEYEAIVVKQNNKYGLVDSSGKLILPCILDSFYMTVEAGKASYQMAQGTNDQISVEAWMNQQGIEKINPTDDDIVVDTSTNTVETETVNEVSDKTTNEVVEGNTQTDLSENQNVEATTN